MADWAPHAAVVGLVFARCGAMLAIAPPLNLRQFPVTLRVGLAAVPAVALAPTATVAAGVGTVSIGGYAALLVREASVGLLTGFAAALVFYAFMVAGQLLDTWLGAGDAASRAAGRGPFAGLTYVLAAAVFVAIDGHHWVLAALADGLRALPVGGGVALGGLAAVVGPARAMLWAGVAIAAPALAAIYAAEVALAAFDRLAPGLGLAEVATPVRWTTALLGFAVTVPLFGALVTEHGTRAIEALSGVIALLGGR